MNIIEKPNIKDYQYSNDEMRDLVGYTEALEKYIEYLENKADKLSILDIVERISRMKDDSGRDGCTYGDTDYDSMSVVYGYNMAIDNVIEVMNRFNNV